MLPDQSPLLTLVRTISAGDETTALRLIAASPGLAQERVQSGADRDSAVDYYLRDVQHYVYAGDTALHIAAAAYRNAIASRLVATGADVRARNRRGAEPLHYAADGIPGAPSWRPTAQAATIASLIETGADPGAPDKDGVMPLHRAVRTRCASAVRALLEGGADPRSKNKRGSSPMDLATRNTGRGGSGSPESKAQQEEIVRLLRQWLAR